jgi:hypothetical protein
MAKFELKIRPMSMVEASRRLAEFIGEVYADDIINMNVQCNVPVLSVSSSSSNAQTASELLLKCSSEAAGLEIAECLTFSVHPTKSGLPSIEHQASSQSLHIGYNESHKDRVTSLVRAVAAHFWRPPFQQPSQDGAVQFTLQYQDLLQQLGAKLASLQALSADFITAEQSRFQTMADDLEARYQAKNQELIRRQEVAEALLLKGQGELREREERIDLRDSKAVRRNLLDDVRAVISNRKSIALSDTTNNKRNAVHALCIISLFAFALLLIWGFYFAQLNPDGGIITVIPISGGLLGFGSTMIYYMRWNDHWQRRHAEAEFRDMKFNDDILRASWLAELIFEWESEKGGVFPEELVHNFSRGLFIPQDGGAIEHPAEVLSNLLKEARSIKVGKGILELESSPRVSSGA